MRHRLADSASAEPRRTPVVLIVDRDLGFVWWLGEILNNAECDAVPALNCREAMTIANDLKLDVDVLFVNPKLVGVPALTRSLSRANRPAKIIDIRKRPHSKQE